MRRFLVWAVDDIIAGAVTCMLDGFYKGAIRIESFGSAKAAAESAYRARSVSDIPDIARIDLRFNANTDHELLKNVDHLSTTLQAAVQDGQHNQLGFWVAQEIKHAARRLQRTEPDVRIYTASLHNINALGWAIAPSPYSHEPYIRVDEKDGSADEIFQDIYNGLWEGTRSRFRHLGVLAGLLPFLMRLRDLAARICKAQQSEDMQAQRNLVAESACNLATALRAKRKDLETREQSNPLNAHDKGLLNNLLAVPYSYLEQASSSRWHLGLHDKIGSDNGPTLSKVSSDASLSDEYKAFGDAYDALGTLQARATRDVSLDDEEEFALMTDRMKLDLPIAEAIQADIPNLWAVLRSGWNDAAGILNAAKTTLELAGEGDYHWSLCRALHKIGRPDEHGSREAETKLAKACHGYDLNGQPITEDQLAGELHGYPLPEATKCHLRQGDANLEYPPAGPTRPLLDLANAWQQGNARRKHWEHRWADLSTKLPPDWTVRIDSADLDGRTHLTDWRLFFPHNDDGCNAGAAEGVEHECAVLSRLLEQLPPYAGTGEAVIQPIGDGDDGASECIRLVLSAHLDRPLDALPTGGLLSVLNTWCGWGQVHWCAMVKDGENSRLIERPIWPLDPPPIFPTGLPLPESPHFTVVWTVRDYLIERVPPGGDQ